MYCIKIFNIQTRDYVGQETRDYVDRKLETMWGRKLETMWGRKLYLLLFKYFIKIYIYFLTHCFDKIYKKTERNEKNAQNSLQLLKMSIRLRNWLIACSQAQFSLIRKMDIFLSKIKYSMKKEKTVRKNKKNKKCVNA